MNGSTENRAWDAPEKSTKQKVVLNLGTARKMLPLVARIVGDILDLNQRLHLLAPEQAHLDRQRRTLDWASRSRRYQLREEVNEAESLLKAARLELEQLGVALLDPGKGQVGFPTVVNGHLAFFSWIPGDEGLRHWHFAGEASRHTIPASWKESGEIRLIGNKS
jgi:hypothetical protein